MTQSLSHKAHSSDMVDVSILRRPEPYRAILETAFQNNVMRYNEGSVETCCLSRTSNKEKYLKVDVHIFLSHSDM